MVLSESGAVLTDRRTAERRMMQVGSSISNRYYTPYQTNTSVKYCAGFLQTEDGKLAPDETTENPGFADRGERNGESRWAIRDIRLIAGRMR